MIKYSNHNQNTNTLFQKHQINQTKINLQTKNSIRKTEDRLKNG